MALWKKEGTGEKKQGVRHINQQNNDGLQVTCRKKKKMGTAYPQLERKEYLRSAG